MIRTREPELMDDPTANPAELATVLRVLNRSNRILGVDRRMYGAICDFGDAAELSILDLGSGGGGFLEYSSRSGVSRDRAMRVGLDRSPVMVRMARTWHGDRLDFVVGDALAVPFAEKSIDVVTCSLFLHHFDPPQVQAILREMARVARIGVVVCDLTRSRISLALTWLVTHVTSRSRLFHVDGPRSVRAAFQPEEMLAMASDAGLIGARAKRIFPFRFLMTWKRAS